MLYGPPHLYPGDVRGTRKRGAGHGCHGRYGGGRVHGVRWLYVFETSLRSLSENAAWIASQ